MIDMALPGNVSVWSKPSRRPVCIRTLKKICPSYPEETSQPTVNQAKVGMATASPETRNKMVIIKGISAVSFQHEIYVLENYKVSIKSMLEKSMQCTPTHSQALICTHKYTCPHTHIYTLIYAHIHTPIYPHIQCPKHT